MSRHKKHRTRPDNSSGDLAGAVLTAYNWSSVRRIVKAYDTGIEFSQNEHIGPDRFFKLLEDLDITDSLPAKLDRPRIAAIPPAYRDMFVRRYISACITQMADQLGWLDLFKTTAIVSLPESAGRAGQNPPAREPPKANEGPYAFLDPATAPFEDRIPRFHGTFLGILQGRLERILTAKGLIMARPVADDELDLLMGRASNKLPDERLFGECRTAATDYYSHVMGNNEPLVTPLLSRMSGPYMFLWLRSSGLLGDMVMGLLRGKPMMRTRTPDPSGKVAYEPTEFGAESGLW